MKRLFLWSFALMSVFVAALQASAQTVSSEQPAEGNWIKVVVEQPGTVDFYLDLNKTKPLVTGENAESFYIGYSSPFYLYVMPKNGYVFKQIQELGLSKPKEQFNVSDKAGGQYYNKFVGTSVSGKTMTISTSALNRGSEVILTVSNNADQLTGYFLGLQAAIDFSDGTRTLKFDPAIETGIYIQCNNAAKKCYSIKLNGEEVSAPNTYGAYNITGLKESNTLDIKVNEQALKDITITYELPEGFENCISNIRDWTAGKFVTATDNKVTVLQGSDIAFNFASEGYVFTDFLLNGTSIMDKFNSSTNRLRFIATEDATLKIEGKAAEYEKIPMTAYLLNPEGVKIKAGKNTEENYVDLAGATAITADVTLPAFTHTDSEGNVTYVTPSYTLTPENAKKIEFTVEDRQYYNAYIYPAEGWYIATVVAQEGSAMTEIPYADKEEVSTFYVVALPLANKNTATIDIAMSEADFNKFVFKGNESLAANWNNPATTYDINLGTNTIKFTDGYQTPFTAASRVVNASMHAVVDGLVVPQGDAETITSYTLDIINGSKVQIGTDKIEAYAFNLSVTASTATSPAEVTYSPLKRVATGNMNLLAGTPVTIKPTTENCMITVNGEVIYSPKNGINELTDGVYSFNMSEAITATVSDDAELVAITKTNPIEGQAVAEFDSYRVYLPALTGENMFYFNENNLAQIKVTNGTKTIAATGIEPSMDGSGATFYIIYFETIDQAGNYTVTIPEGFFYEAAWNDTAETFTAVDGGKKTKAFTGTFTIDANALPYHVVPAPDSKVNDLSHFEITFPDASGVEYTEGTAITLKGTDFSTSTTFVSEVKGGNYVTFAIDFGTMPAAAGEYTLEIPAGTFTIDGWKESVACTAKYNYTPVYTLTPASGSTIQATEFTISFPEATKVTLAGSKFDIHLSAGNTYATPSMNVEEVDASVPTFKLSLDAEAQRPPFGPLSLTIDEGVFMIDGKESPFISAKYIYEGTVSAEYSCEPAGTKILLPTGEWDMVMWTFIFDEAISVGGTDNLAETANVTVNGTKRAFMAMPEQNMLMMALESKDGIADGEILRVEIPAGAFTISGTPSPAIDRSWTLVKAKTYTWKANPESGTTVSEIKEITVTFEGASSVVVNENSNTVDIKQGYTVIGTMTATGGEGGVLKLTAETPVKTTGTYKIQISPYLLLIDEVQTLEDFIELTYTVDPSAGIDDIVADGDGKVTVVTLDGRIVLDKADASELKTLSTGIYVINGHKVMLRK